MSYTNVKVISTGVYHPSNMVDNNYAIDAFKKVDQDIQGLLNFLGRDKRYISNDLSETAVTMAIEASNSALKKANISAEELDMIVFVSDFPEYIVPTNALKVHHGVRAKNSCIVFDMNNNCIGGITAIETISRYMKGHKKVKKALIVASILPSPCTSLRDPVTFSGNGDLAAAIILEKVEEEIERGFIETEYYTNSEYHTMVELPGCGYANLYRHNYEHEDDIKIHTAPLKLPNVPDYWCNIITKLLSENGLTANDVDEYIFSQFSINYIESTLNLLGQDASKALFIGNEVGYNGCASPIAVLDRAIELGRIKEGKVAIFCSVASGFSACAMLFKF